MRDRAQQVIERFGYLQLDTVAVAGARSHAIVLASRLEGFDPSLEEASRDLGCGAWTTFWRLTFPLALPGVISSLLMGFIISFDEFVISFFLSGTETTLPVYLFSQLRFPNKLPGVLALGSLIAIVSIIAGGIAGLKYIEWRL